MKHCANAPCTRAIPVELWAVRLHPTDRHKKVVCPPCFERLLRSGKVDIDDIERLSDEPEDFERIRGRKRGSGAHPVAAVAAANAF